MGRFLVYAYREPGANQPFYIGKGLPNRPASHLCGCNLKKYNTLFYRKLRALLNKQVMPEIEIIVDSLTEDQAFALEKTLIKIWGRLDQGTGCLTNQTDGGEGPAGRNGKSPSFDNVISRSKPRKGLARLNIQQGHEKFKKPVESYSLITKETIKVYDSARATERDGFHRGNVQAVCDGRKNHHGLVGWRYTKAPEIATLMAKSNS